jgi:hypothetical protein
VRNQYHFPAFALAPAASELAMQLNEVNGPLILVRPSGILDLPEFWIHQHQASRAKKRVHSSIILSYIAIEVF